MSAASALLDRLGRPGGIRLGPARPVPIPRLPTGIPTLDAALGGGLPRGRVTQLTGPRSTGRTGLACAIAASATRNGETIAWVDPEDALDPETAAAAGMTLARTLWVRPRSVADARRATTALLDAGGFGLVVLDIGEAGATGTARRQVPFRPPAASALLVVARRHAVWTGAALGLAVTGHRVRWSGGPERLPLLDGIDARVTVTRSRIGPSGETLVVREHCA
jgi:hypothetical protein